MILSAIFLRITGLFIISFILNNKGRKEDNFWPWFFAGIIAPYIAIIVSLCMTSRKETITIQDEVVDL